MRAEMWHPDARAICQSPPDGPVLGSWAAIDFCSLLQYLSLIACLRNVAMSACLAF